MISKQLERYLRLCRAIWLEASMPSELWDASFIHHLHDERREALSRLSRDERIEAEKHAPCRRCGKFGCHGDGRDVRIVERDGKLTRTVFYCSID